MLLSKIFENSKVKVSDDIEIKGITSDSRKVEEGYLFIAISGFEMDGHKFIDSAIEKGAKAILINEDRFDEFKDRNAYRCTENIPAEIIWKRKGSRYCENSHHHT